VPIRFGEFALDPARRELRRQDRTIHVSPQGLQFLELLLDHHSRVVSKEEIRTALWPDTFVAEGSLARVANELRAALSDDARDPRLIRTIHGVGYAFAGDISERGGVGRAGDSSRLSDISGMIENDPQPRRFSCRLVWDSRRIPLREGENVVGRAADAVVAIESPRVSRRHARITVSGVEAMLEDLGSKNGTFLDGQRIEAPTELRDGDEIEVGPVRLLFRRGLAGLDTTETG
jgi:DNA-binding winged helix-turn-helix (wHTH) protein